MTRVIAFILSIALMAGMINVNTIEAKAAGSTVKTVNFNWAGWQSQNSESSTENVNCYHRLAFYRWNSWDKKYAESLYFNSVNKEYVVDLGKNFSAKAVDHITISNV